MARPLEYILPDELVGHTLTITSFYGSEMKGTLEDGRAFEITLEDSGMGYGEGGYVEHLEMQCRVERRSV